MEGFIVSGFLFNASGGDTPRIIWDLEILKTGSI